MKKTLILLISFLALSIFAFSEVKIGIVNAEEIISKTIRGKAIQTKLEAFQNKKQQEIQVLDEEIKKLEKEISNPALNDETRDKKSLDLANKKKNIQRLIEDARNDIQRESQTELITLEKDLMPIINEIGKSKGFTIVFDSTRPGIVYIDPTIDITEDVIKAVDAKFPK